MAFQEDLMEFLDIEQGFAVEAQFIPAHGSPCLVKGIFSNNYHDIEAGLAGVMGMNPIFECTHQPIGEVDYGDFITIKEVNYRIVGIRPDGTGWLTMDLEKQS